jgi:hypothetical protein
MGRGARDARTDPAGRYRANRNCASPRIRTVRRCQSVTGRFRRIGRASARAASGLVEGERYVYGTKSAPGFERFGTSQRMSPRLRWPKIRHIFSEELADRKRFPNRYVVDEEYR